MYLKCGFKNHVTKTNLEFSGGTVSLSHISDGEIYSGAELTS